MAPLVVDPTVLDGAGATVIAVGDGLAAAISGLTAALAGTGGMAGDDPAGAELGHNYDRSASKLLEAMATTRNGLSRLGDGVRMSAHNYSLAEGQSDLFGRGGALPVPSLTPPVKPGSAPSSVGTGTSTPPGWGWVAPYIGMIWPTGDSAKLRAAAAAWVTAGTKFGVTEIQGCGGVLGPIRAQRIPEGGVIDAAFTDAYQSTTRIVENCQKIADQLNAYADKIDKVHKAILDLLSRICDPLTGLKEVWDILTDKDEDEIKKIADDIRTVVNNFTAQARALGREIAAVLTDAENVVSAMGNYAAKEWDQFLHGTDVGRALNQTGQYFKGFGTEAFDFCKDNVQYGIGRMVVDPIGFYHDWGQRLEGMAPLVGLGGDGAPSVGKAWKDVGKDALHWDEWSTNPADAAGKSTFDVLSTFLGGGSASKLAKALRGGARVGEDLKLPEPHSDPKPHPAEVAPKPQETPPPSGKPAPAPDSTKPKPGGAKPAPPGTPQAAPPASGAPHSPTEHKPPITAKPGTGEPGKVPVEPAPSKPDQVPIAKGPPDAPPPASHPSAGRAPQPGPSGPPAHAPTAPPLPKAPPLEPTPSGVPPASPPPVDGGLPSGHPPEMPPPTDGGLPTSHPSDGAPGMHGDSDGQSGAHDGNGERSDDGGGGPSSDSGDEPPRAKDVFPDAKPYGELTEREYLEQFEDKNGNLIYPDEDDPTKPYAISGTAHDMTDGEILRDLDGRTVDRVGSPYGGWLAPEGTPYEGRSLPHTSLEKPYFAYTVHAEAGLPPGWKIEVSRAAPWFGQHGGDVQYRIIAPESDRASVQELIDRQFLKQIKSSGAGNG